MAIQPGFWGIDIGQSALKAIRVENADGVIKATAFDYIEHAKILSQPDADPDQLTQDALKKFLSRNKLQGDKVLMSVPGQSGLARFVKLPPVEEKKIGDIVRFEAKQQIPFNLDEVVWDYQKIGSGIVTDGFAMDTEIGLFAIKRDTVNRALAHFKEVDLEVEVVQMAPLSLCNYIAYDLLHKDSKTTEGEEEAAARKQCVVALDIGVESSNLVITDGGRIIWQRPIPIGGNRFTRALTRELKLTFAKAEHLKRNATKSPDLRKILLALKADLNEFVNEVQRSLGYFTNTHRDAEVKYLVGLGNAFRLPGLQKYLNEKLQLDVRKVQKFSRLTGDSVLTAPVFAENVLGFAVAYGLAIQGLSMGRLQTNLLPPEIQLHRIVRSKKPWALAGAAALLLGTATLMFGLGTEKKAVAAPVINSALAEAKQTIQSVEDWKQKCAAEKGKVAASQRALQSIEAGQQERLNWLNLHKFILDSLPRSDGKNLAEGQKKYWDDKAQEAYKKLSTQGDVGAEGAADLIQVNLECMNTYYVQNLEAYFQRVKEMKPELYGMSAKDRNKPPQGAGWIIDLRGFTYHKGQKEFLKDVLIANLTSRPMLATKKPAPAPAKPAAAAPAPAPAPMPAGPAAKPPPKPVSQVSHALLFDFKLIAEGQKSELMEVNDVFRMLTVETQVKRAATPPVPGAPPGAPPAAAVLASAPSVGGKWLSNWKPLLDWPAYKTTGVLETKSKPVPSEGLIRTEFIVLFVWKEPLRSEQLKRAAPAAPAPGTPGAAAQPK